MEQVNQQRGSIPTPPKGQTFAEALERWRTAIAPHLSPATLRARESYLRNHITPRFGKCDLAEIGVHELQTFVTELRQSVSAQTVNQILAAIFGVMHYAEKCGAKVPEVSYEDLEVGSLKREAETPLFTRAQVADIIASARADSGRCRSAFRDHPVSLSKLCSPLHGSRGCVRVKSLPSPWMIWASRTAPFASAKARMITPAKCATNSN
jgi:Phage integrase, N-terminal SAM-like domain